MQDVQADLTLIHMHLYKQNLCQNSISCDLLLETHHFEKFLVIGDFYVAEGS